MTDFFEFFKVVGSLSGLIAGVFLVWDRYTKHYPVAIIVPRPLMPGSQQISHFLYVKNVSDRPILVSWQHGTLQGQLRVAKDQSSRGIMRSMLDDETVISLGSDDYVYLPVLNPSRYDDIDAGTTLEIHLRWRFAQPRIWNSDRKIPISIRKCDYDSMVENYIAPS